MTGMRGPKFIRLIMAIPLLHATGAATGALTAKAERTGSITDEPEGRQCISSEVGHLYNNNRKALNMIIRGNLGE